VVFDDDLGEVEGLAAPVRVAVARLSWIRATSLSSPIRWRQRVIERLAGAVGVDRAELGLQEPPVDLPRRFASGWLRSMIWSRRARNMSV